MKILTYHELYNNNNINNFINIDIIDKLIYNNINYYHFNNLYYYLLVVPSLNINSNIKQDNYSKIIEKTKRLNIDFSVPSIILTKIIVIYNKKLKKFIIIKTDKTKNNTIINYMITLSNELHSFINIINNLVLKINNKLININYLDINSMMVYVDKLIIILHYCGNIIQQFDNISILINKSHEYYYILNANIINLNNINIKLKKDLENIRSNSFQKITYMETGTSRILTSIATIFLPLSFIIAFFSLPFKKVPLQNNNNGIFYIIIILIIICISISVYYYYYKNGNNKLSLSLYR